MSGNKTPRQLAKQNIEVWKTIPDFPKYEVSNLGRVKSKRKVLKCSSNNRGYPSVSLYKEDYRIQYPKHVHRIVLDTFDGPKKDGQICRHLDGNPQNNRLDNICWGTYKENHEDSIKHGTYVKPPKLVQIGEKNHSVKLTEEDVLFIRASKESAKDLAKMFEISHWTIFDIRAGLSWKHLLPKEKLVA